MNQFFVNSNIMIIFMIILCNVMIIWLSYDGHTMYYCGHIRAY